MMIIIHRMCTTSCENHVFLFSIHLSCWLDLEQYRRTNHKDKAVRLERSSQITTKYLNRKYFFGSDSPATAQQQGDVSHMVRNIRLSVKYKCENSVKIKAPLDLIYCRVCGRQGRNSVPITWQTRDGMTWATSAPWHSDVINRGCCSSHTIFHVLPWHPAGFTLTSECWCETMYSRTGVVTMVGIKIR